MIQLVPGASELLRLFSKCEELVNYFMLFIKCEELVSYLGYSMSVR